MYLFCPKCHAQYPAASRCPKCSSRLLSPGEAADVLTATVALPPDPVETTYAGRVGVGCVVALGLHLAFREWAAAGLGATADAADPVGFLLGFFLRLVTAGFGGLLAGAGRRLNFSGGFSVGAVCGLGWLLFDQYPLIVVDAPRLGLAVVIAVAAGLAAMAGGQLWPEAVKVPEPPSPRGSSIMGLTPGGATKPRTRPTRWLQMMVAAGLAVGGVASAEWLRSGLRGIPGMSQAGGPLAAGRLDFQISAVALMVASVVAGAGTGAGLRHGVIAGALTAAGVIALHARADEGALPGIDWLIEAACAPDAAASTVRATVGGLTLAAMAVGGWLGGQLMPALRKTKRRQRGEF